MIPVAANDRTARAVWIALLAALTAAMTVTYTCIAPFAALGVAAAMTLPRREALAGAAVVWLANQATGFGMLGYPWTLHALGWGVAIGAGAMVATVSAQWLVPLRLRPPVRAAIAFPAAFAAYELVLLAAALTVLGGGAFAPGIVAQVLVVNAVTLVGLYGLSHVFALAATACRRRAPASPARVA